MGPGGAHTLQKLPNPSIIIRNPRNPPGGLHMYYRVKPGPQICIHSLLSTTSSVVDHVGLPELVITVNEAVVPPELMLDANNPIY